MKEISNFDIIKICRELNINLVYVGYKNEILNDKPVDGGYILNMTDSTDDAEGSHWVALYIKGNNACYYDSFGVGIVDDVISFLSNKSKIYYNKTQQQHIDSVLCGWFCVLFLYIFQFNEKRKSYPKLYEYMQGLFTTNYKENDGVLKRIFKQ